MMISFFMHDVITRLVASMTRDIPFITIVLLLHNKMILRTKIIYGGGIIQIISDFLTEYVLEA